MHEPEVHDRRWWALAILCLCLFVITLDNTILNVAIPSLVGSLHASTSQLQWIIDGYTLVFAGLLLTTGSLGDRFGRKGALSVGLVVFCTGSVASAFAASATMLIFTRAFMGIGGALIMPATLSLLTNIFTDPRERARAIGAWAAVAGGAGAAGPLLGGFLLQHFWWGSVFLINVPVAVIAFIAARLLLPASRDPDAPPLDLLGAFLSVTGLIAVLWSIIEVPDKGWSDPSVVASFAAGATIVAAFVWWELHAINPMLDMRFFRNRRFSAANASITMVFFAMFGSMFLITQYLQTVLGYSAFEAGLRMLPMAAIMLVVAPSAPRLVERIGTKLVVGGGLAMASGGLGLASTVTISSGYPLLFGSVGILAVGMGLVMAPATESIMGSLPPSKAGVGSAMNDTTRQIGSALGVAVLGSITAAAYRPGVVTRLTALHAPGRVIDAAKQSVGGAIGAGATLPAPLRQLVDGAAKAEFVHAFAGTLVAASLIVMLASLVAFAFLPARAAAGHVHSASAGRSNTLDALASLTFAEAEGVLEGPIPITTESLVASVSPAPYSPRGRTYGLPMPAGATANTLHEAPRGCTPDPSGIRAGRATSGPPDDQPNAELLVENTP